MAGHRSPGVVDRVLPDRVAASFTDDVASVRAQVPLEVCALHAIVSWIDSVASIPAGGAASWFV